MSAAWNEYALADGTEIRPLPKVSLHDHLDGGLRPATVNEGCLSSYPALYPSFSSRWAAAAPMAAALAAMWVPRTGEMRASEGRVQVSAA